MKSPSLIGTLIVLVFLATATTSMSEYGSAQPVSQPCDITGTWRMVAYLYDGASRYSDGVVNLLFFNDTHWVQIAEIVEDPPDDPMPTVRGVYSIVGDSLYRTREIGVPSRKGLTSAFWCKTDGRVLYLNSYEQGSHYEFKYERVVPENRQDSP